MAMPPLPRRRRGACPAGNPATLKADLDDVLGHNADLAVRLVRTQHYVDRANQALADFGEELRKAHARLRAVNENLAAENAQLRADRDGLRRQLDDALGYGPAEKAAIASGKGEPLVRGAST